MTAPTPETAPVLHRKVTEVANNLRVLRFNFDPTALVDIITKILEFFRGCRQTPEQIVQRSSNPRLLDKIWLRRQVRRQEGRGGDTEAIEVALIDAGESLTTQELVQMYQEIPQSLSQDDVMSFAMSLSCQEGDLVMSVDPKPSPNPEPTTPTPKPYPSPNPSPTQPESGSEGGETD